MHTHPLPCRRILTKFSRIVSLVRRGSCQSVTVGFFSVRMPAHKKFRQTGPVECSGIGNLSSSFQIVSMRIHLISPTVGFTIGLRPVYQLSFDSLR